MSGAQSISVLQERFGIQDLLRFEVGEGGLARAVVSVPWATAVIYLHGAHVADFQPAGQRPLLFMSKRSAFDTAKPIRGGVPICFPWFGPRAGDPRLPLHGFARVQTWIVESTSSSADAVKAVFTLQDSEITRKVWGFPFALRYTATIGTSLSLQLEVHNRSERPMTFEEALHTYLAVADVREVAIGGLGGVSFIDKVDGMKRKVQSAEPIRISGETDRVYVNTQSACIIDDVKGGRRIVVEKSGSNTTVVWNPWIAKAKAMPDFGDNEWPEMLCVEAANAMENAVRLLPGEHHTIEARVRAQPQARQV